MRYFPILFCTILLATTPSSAQADPARKPALECTAGGLTAQPKFTQLSPGRAEYSFGGACISRYGASFTYRLDATWTPSERSSGNANATEILHIDMLSGTPQSYTILLGARCSADPWLYTATCERVGDNVPESVRAWWYDVTSAQFPFSRFGIPSSDQRIAFREEYARANSLFDDSGAYSDRAAIETIEKAGAQGGIMGMSEQAAPAAARPAGTEAGIIISGNPPQQQTAAGEISMVELQSVVSQRATAVQAATGMLSEINQANRNVAANVGGGPAAPSAPKPEPPICANARAARARNSPAAPGLERQCVAAGGNL